MNQESTGTKYLMSSLIYPQPRNMNNALINQIRPSLIAQQQWFYDVNNQLIDWVINWSFNWTRNHEL